jgi:hypothetical protein
MANLTDDDRKEVWREFMRQVSSEKESLAVTLNKQDLRAAVDAADTWVSDNAASFNSALPQPARASLTTAQKARLNSLIVLKRFTSGA